MEPQAPPPELATNAAASAPLHAHEMCLVMIMIALCLLTPPASAIAVATPAVGCDVDYELVKPQAPVPPPELATNAAACAACWETRRALCCARHCKFIDFTSACSQNASMLFLQVTRTSRFHCLV